MPIPNVFPDLVSVFTWSVVTIAFYLATKHAYRRWRHWWLMPLIATPTTLALVLLALGTGYQDYAHGAGWLVTLLGPATVAFAVPIYEQRAEIRRFWPVLAVGMVVGSLTSIFAAWGMATALEVEGALRLSLLPRSISTPFAMIMSGDIGGVPELTAVFVVITGVFGAMIGPALLNRLPLRSNLARGSLFGMGAHAVGTARAHQIGSEIGSISGLVMVLAGLMNVLLAPVVLAILR